MARFKLLLVLFAIFFFNVYCFAQDQDNETKIPSQQPGPTLEYTTFGGVEVHEPGFKPGSGMEIITIRGTNVLVPKGAKVIDKGSSVEMEDIGSYVGRRFYETEKRLDRIELKQNELKNELGKIKQALEDLNKQALTSK